MGTQSCSKHLINASTVSSREVTPPIWTQLDVVPKTDLKPVYHIWKRIFLAKNIYTCKYVT